HRIQIIQDRQRMSDHRAIDLKCGRQSLRVHRKIVPAALRASAEIHWNSLEVERLETHSDSYAIGSRASEEAIKPDRARITRANSVRQTSRRRYAGGQTIGTRWGRRRRHSSTPVRLRGSCPTSPA